jgi:hypothetical protein
MLEILGEHGRQLDVVVDQQHSGGWHGYWKGNAIRHAASMGQYKRLRQLFPSGFTQLYAQ